MQQNGLRFLSNDWYGAKVPGCPQWILAVEDNYLTLHGTVFALPIIVPQDVEGVFAEGLWEGDVVELFLLNPKTGYYIEFNLGPKGGWWCCTFDAPRKRTSECQKPIPRVKTKAIITENGWCYTLAIPIGGLPQKLNFCPCETKGNITFCLGNPQQYLTLADLGDGEPDFHRPDKWIVLSEILYNKSSS